ncbi:MAG: response regulator [Bdellovibrionales bacterium]
MALRVLLADESSTIKKVFQLALQDFAVEVRPVNVGVDVLAVAKNFKPDIVFADVLLQKRSGYEVSAELKQDPNTRDIPVVLMWSGFMELDEDKFQASHADAQLEKPFDVTALRSMVSQLVPRTQGNRISQFLSFPKMPEIEDKAPPAPSEPMVELDGAREEFSQVPLPKIRQDKATADKFRLDLKPEELEPEHLPVEYDMPVEEEPFTLKETHAPKKPSGPPAVMKDEVTAEGLDIEDLLPDDDEISDMDEPSRVGTVVSPSLSEAKIEEIIRQQAAEIIESVVWKVVPDLAAQIIERELNKLLKERDSQPY